MKRVISGSSVFFGVILGVAAYVVFSVERVSGQSRQPVQPASRSAQPAPIPPNREAVGRPNPLRGEPLRGTIASQAAAASPVRLASGQVDHGTPGMARTSDSTREEPQKLAINDFPEPPTSGNFLDAAGFADLPPQPAPPASGGALATPSPTTGVPAAPAPVVPVPAVPAPQGFSADGALVPPPNNGSLFGADPFGTDSLGKVAAPAPAAPSPLKPTPESPQEEAEVASPFAATTSAPAVSGFPEQETQTPEPSPFAPTAPAAHAPRPIPQEPALPESVESARDTGRVTSGGERATTSQPAPLVQENTGAVPTQAGEGTGIPGPKSIHGAQTAQIQIEKIFPAEIQVDQRTALQIVVKNVGETTAEEVVLTDQVPQGTRFLSADPRPGMQEGGDLAWELGSIEAGKEVVVTMQILPLREGEIGSVARVMFVSSASGKVAVTRPMLKVEVNAPKEVLIGQTVNLDIVLSNPGSGTATGVVLEEFIPEGFHHKDGKQLLNKIGRLKPKETLKLSLPLQAVGAGKIANRLVVRADNNLNVEEKTVVDVLAPVLELKIEGAKTRYLDRRATYQLTVANPGTASASNVDLVCRLPTSMQFVSTNQSGLYEASTHTVHWALEELPAGEAGQIELVTLPVKAGEHKLKFAGSGRNGLKNEVAHDVSIDGLASVSFSVACLSDLVEVGKDTVYEISVVNRGTKASSNVVVGVQLSKGMSFVSAEGPVKHKAEEGIVQFNPLGKIDPKSEKTYRVTARCLDDGDHRISVKLLSDDLQAPITKEESTRVIK